MSRKATITVTVTYDCQTDSSEGSEESTEEPQPSKTHRGRKTGGTTRATKKKSNKRQVSKVSQAKQKNARPVPKKRGPKSRQSSKGRQVSKKGASEQKEEESEKSASDRDTDSGSGKSEAETQEDDRRGDTQASVRSGTGGGGAKSKKKKKKKGEYKGTGRRRGARANGMRNFGIEPKPSRAQKLALIREKSSARGPPDAPPTRTMPGRKPVGLTKSKDPVEQPPNIVIYDVESEVDDDPNRSTRDYSVGVFRGGSNGPLLMSCEKSMRGAIGTIDVPVGTTALVFLHGRGAIRGGQSILYIEGKAKCKHRECANFGSRQSIITVEDVVNELAKKRFNSILVILCSREYLDDVDYVPLLTFDSTGKCATHKVAIWWPCQPGYELLVQGGEDVSRRRILEMCMWDATVAGVTDKAHNRYNGPNTPFAIECRAGWPHRHPDLE